MPQPLKRNISLHASTIACSICGSPSTPVFLAKGYQIYECGNCDYRFCDPGSLESDHVAKQYSDDYFSGGGAGYQDYLAERELLIRHGERYADLLAKYMPAGELLDVGAAAGFLMRGFANRGWTASGIEANAMMADYANQEFDQSVVDQGTLEGYSPGRQYDVVSLIQVIAHFADLPDALESASRLTKPGGYWLIESWNFQSLTARVLNKHWHEYSPPTVLHWLSPNGLQRMAEKFDMKFVAQGRPRKYLDGEHAKSLLRYRLRGTPIAAVAEYASKLVPDRLQIRYPAEDLFWVLLQKEA